MAIQTRRSTQTTLHKGLALVARWGWFVALCAVLAGVGGFVATRLQRPVYRATALLVVDQRVTGQDTYSDVLASTQLVTLYEGLISQPVVLQQVINDTPGLSAAELAAQLHVSALTGSPEIQIQVDNPSPAEAAALANAVANAFVAVEQQSSQAALAHAQQQIQQELQQVTAEIGQLNTRIADLRNTNPSDPGLQALQQQLDTAVATRNAEQDAEAQLIAQDLGTGPGIRVFQPAVPPVTPDHPSPVLNGLEAAALGFVVALGIAFVLQVLDDRIRTREDLEDLTGLGTIGTVGTIKRRRRLGAHGMRSAFSEDSSLHTAVLLADDKNGPLRTLLLTGPTRGTGTTMVAINLAISLAQVGKRVLLVDADLRDPAIHTYLGLDNTTGLAGLLMNESQGVESCGSFATIAEVPNLYVLTAGPEPPNPTALLASDGMHRLIRLVLTSPWQGEAGAIDVIVLDSAPVGDYADALLLATRANGTIVVVDVAHARARDVRRTVDALLEVNAYIPGVVLNRVKSRRTAAYPRAHDATGAGAGVARHEDLDRLVATAPDGAD